MKEIFDFLDNIPKSSKDEIFETLISSDNIKIERIISYGQTSPKDFWYDQDQNEFVLVLEGKATIKYEDGKTFDLTKGSSLLISSHTKHKVIYTKTPTIWLAIFFD